MADPPKLLFVAALGSCGFLPAVHGQPTLASIQGRAVSEDGNPVPNAEVTYASMPRGALDARGRWVEANEPRISSKTLAGGDGLFAVSDLPAREYLVCVDAPGFLRSCDWAGFLRVALTSAQAATIPEVRLVKAAVFQIRVNDPAHLLTPENRIERPLAIGVFDENNHYHPAETVSADASGRNLELRIPYSRQLQIWVHSWKYDLTGAKGRAISSKGTRIQLRVEPGTTPPRFEVTIAAEKPIE